MSDPRGPYRTIVAKEFTPQAWLVTLDCGHIANMSAHMTQGKVGDREHCFACKQEVTA